MKKTLCLAMLAVLLSPLSVTAFDEEEERHYRVAAEFVEFLGFEKKIGGTVDDAVAGYLRENPELTGQTASVTAFYAKYLGWGALENEMLDLFTAAYSEKEMRRMIESAPDGTELKADEAILELYREGVSIGMARAGKHMDEVEEALSKP